MTPGLISVYDRLVPLFPDFMVYYDVNQMLTEGTMYDCEYVSHGTDVTYGDYVQYSIENQSIGKIITDRGINVAQKYNATINETYTTLQIIEHTTDGVIDLIKIIKVPSVVFNPLLPEQIDPATKISLSLLKSIFLQTQPYEVTNFNPRKTTMFSGEGVTIQISTKFDRDRQTLEDAEVKIMQNIMANHRKFDITKAGVTKGYYKLMELPNISGFINNFDNLQQILINLRGYYLMDY